MMQNRSRVINRLALVLLSIVVLELVLIGDRVQPVKAIKKKILIKKLKKMLPLLALIKPKKKIILLPIPIPMFNKHSQQYPRGTYQTGQMVPFVPSNINNNGGGGFVGAVGPQLPTQFMMMTGEPMDGNQLPMSMNMVPYESAPMIEPSSGPTGGAGGNMSASADSPQPVAMMMPSMTMTIQSEPGGSNIELSAGSMNPIGGLGGRSNVSAPLMQGGTKYSQYNQEFDDQFTFNEPAGGEQYYSSPWGQRSPLTSPAKLLRSRPQNQQQQHQQQQPVQQRFVPTSTTTTTSTTLRPTAYHHQTFTMMTSTRPPTVSGRLQQRAQPPQQQQHLHMPLLVIQNQGQWRPSKQSPASRLQQPPQQQQQQQPHQLHYREPPQQQHQSFHQQTQQQQNNQALEYEELVPLGPAQVMPVYQTPNGQLHLSPPNEQQQQERQQQQQQQQPPPPTRLPNQGSSIVAPPSQPSHNQDSFSELEDQTSRPVDVINNNNSQMGFQTIGNGGQQNNNDSTNGQSARQLSSPSAKGKQLQASGHRKTQISGGGY